MFEWNETAYNRGMEAEQFQQLKWLLGDSKSRSPEQKQEFKDFITTWVEGLNPDFLLDHLDRVDNNGITVGDSVLTMQTVQDIVNRGTGDFVGI